MITEATRTIERGVRLGLGWVFCSKFIYSLLGLSSMAARQHEVRLLNPMSNVSRQTRRTEAGRFRTSCSTPENSPINPLSRGMQGNEEQTRKGKIGLTEAVDFAVI